MQATPDKTPQRNSAGQISPKSTSNSQTFDASPKNSQDSSSKDALRKSSDKNLFKSTLTTTDEPAKTRPTLMDAQSMVQSQKNMATGASMKLERSNTSQAFKNPGSQSITDPKVADTRRDSVFIDNKKDWITQNSCIVCKKKFDKLKGIFTHHCRLCGNSACGDCSIKKIEEHRVCDVCYMKATDHRAQERRSLTLQAKTDLMYKYAKERKGYKKETAELERNTYELRQTVDEEQASQEKGLDNLKKELVKYKDIIQKKTENNEILKEALKSDRNLLYEKEKEMAEAGRRLNQLNKEIEQKADSLKIKELEYKNLADQKSIYECSPSFLDATHSSNRNTDSVFASQYSQNRSMNSSTNQNPSVFSKY